MNNTKRAYLHPKLEDDTWMIMEIDMGTDRMVFEGILNIEKGIGSSNTEPNGTFYYPGELPVQEPGSATQVYAQYHRYMEGEKLNSVRIDFASSPDPDAEKYGYYAYRTSEYSCAQYESDGPLVELVFISGSAGPGAFMRVPKQA
ncbi:hypothetical protein B0J17DRAFT_624545 [Rhizoctonia solani]|nr:hypothetical protein B0J17DRAFT_624545 [Rhizoctonia solani]